MNPCRKLFKYAYQEFKQNVIKYEPREDLFFLKCILSSFTKVEAFRIDSAASDCNASEL